MSPSFCSITFLGDGIKLLTTTITAKPPPIMPSPLALPLNWSAAALFHQADITGAQRHFSACFVIF